MSDVGMGSTRPLLDILTVDEAVAHVSEQLREHAAAEKWGTQEAVSRWLRNLADDLDECVTELRRPS